MPFLLFAFMTLMLSCGVFVGTPKTTNNSVPTEPGSGRVRINITDAPTDDAKAFYIKITGISLIKASAEEETVTNRKDEEPKSKTKESQNNQAKLLQNEKPTFAKDQAAPHRFLDEYSSSEKFDIDLDEPLVVNLLDYQAGESLEIIAASNVPEGNYALTVVHLDQDKPAWMISQDETESLVFLGEGVGSHGWPGVAGVNQLIVREAFTVESGSDLNLTVHANLRATVNTLREPLTIEGQNYAHIFHRIQSFANSPGDPSRISIFASGIPETIKYVCAIKTSQKNTGQESGARNYSENDCESRQSSYVSQGNVALYNLSAPNFYDLVGYATDGLSTILFNDVRVEPGNDTFLINP